MKPQTNLEELASHLCESNQPFVANEWRLHPDALMFGWIEQESNWDTYSTREEPAFYRRYIKGKNVGRHEDWQLAISWGLLQVMGSTAREMEFRGHYLSQLCAEPALGIHFGIRYLLRQKARGDGSWAQGLAAYNGGLGGTPDNRTRPYRRQEYVDEVVEKARGYAERA